MPDNPSIEIAKSDLLAAWAVLENLAVSFDQIGGTFPSGRGGTNGEKMTADLHHALASYLTPALVQEINAARQRLGRYITDEEAESLVDQIAYWDYKTAPQLAKNA